MLREQHREVLLHTGQHYDDAMSDRFFRELAIPNPDIELGVGSGPHGEQTARMLIGIEQAIVDVRPAAVLVYGDTNSTMAGALAAAKLQVPIAHVEAGLRSYNRAMPEEINRTVTDALSSLLFAPSATAVANLRREGITRGVHEVGDVMWAVLNRALKSSTTAVLTRHGLRPGQYGVVTVHRAENTDAAARWSAILAAIDALDLPVIFPVHPRIRHAVAAHRLPAHVHAVEPLGYADMITAVRHARVVITDSGGLQKEAYWLSVPCITLRDETEWVETVAAGWNVLVGADAERIVAAASQPPRPADRPPLYGEGDVSRRITTLLSEAFAPVGSH